MPNLNLLHESSKISHYDTAEADKIINQIAEILKGTKSCIGLGILNVIVHKVPSWKIILEMKEMIRDNEPVMSRMLGTDLTNRIKIF